MRAGTRRLGGMALVAALAVLAAVPVQAPAQMTTDAEAREQVLLLREASLFENRGEHERAARRFREVLDRWPGATAAVFGLERTLRELGRLPDVLPAVDWYLEARPDGSAVRHLELRVLAELDSTAALAAAGREWMEREGDSLEPYAQMLDVYEEVFGPERALALVRRAREATGRSDVLALAAGGLNARSGRPDEAGREWSRAIEIDDGNLSSVLRQIERLPGDSREVVATLLESLEAGSESSGRLRGAARLALAAGLSRRAVELASGAVEGLDGRARKGFLVRFAQTAMERGDDGVALWAFRELRERPESRREARALDERIAELALAAGDTVLALEARKRVAESRPGGSAARRRALAAKLALEVERLEPDEATARLSAFRSEYPEAPELDALAASLARRLQDRGNVRAAGEVLAGVEGPRSGLERAFLRLDSGEVEAAVEELDASVSGLSPRRATEVLELLTFLEGAGPRGAELAGEVAARAHRGEAEEALRRLRAGLDGVSLNDRPGLLALGARIAEEAGDAEGAAAFRARLLKDFPDAPQTPEAAVRLARHRAGDPEGDREAARILEELILDRPGSAAVPEARRELEKLRERIPGGGGWR